MTARCLSRRRFLRLTGATLLMPVAGGFGSLAGCVRRPLRFGVIADLHHGLSPSAMERLQAFIDEAEARQPDFIVQLGDFNFGTAESRESTDLWESFRGDAYHVLGNHDMDFRTKAEMVESWSMPGRYYSFDAGGYHFVVLDRNNLRTADGYVPYAKANFYVESEMRGHADPEQLEWLEADLGETMLPTIVFVHQGLGWDDASTPEAARTVERVLESAVSEDGRAKVVACFCGHHHLDYQNVKHGIHYVWINSASYYWVGEDYGRMAHYRDPLFAFVTLHRDGVIEVEGRQTDWEPPTPAERSYPHPERLTTYISDLRLTVGT